MQRFFLKFDQNAQKIIISDPKLYHQISKVMRSRPGDKFILVDNNSEAVCSIHAINKKDIEAKIIGLDTSQAETKNIVNLFCAILKRENFELVVQKTVEIGVTNIIPLVSERTIKQGLKIERLRKIIKEAAEQSGRGILPKIFEPVDFLDAVTIAEDNRGSNLFYHCDAPIVGVNNSRSSLTATKIINIFIGPEGGWSQKEAELINTKKDWHMASLGKTILRGETAAIVASYLAVNS